MSLKLRDNLHWCDCGGRAVFLDTEGDRYFCLSEASNHAFLRLAAGEPCPGSGKRLDALVDRGLLIETCSGEGISPPARVDAPTHDYLREPAPAPGPVHLVRALARELRSAWIVRSKSFQQVIDRARRCRPRRPKSPDAREGSIGQIAAAANFMSFITRSHDRCLVRALAAHAACTRQGAPSKLVFGVIAHPFTAHCWVQVGRAVVVGGYEQARLYTPILVLE